MATIGFIRHGYKDKKSASKQKKTIQAYAKKQELKIDSWHEDKNYWESTYKVVSFYYMGYGTPTLKKGDSVIVSNLSKLGSSLRKVIENIHSLTSREVNVYSAEDDLQRG